MALSNDEGPQLKSLIVDPQRHEALSVRGRVENPGISDAQYE